MGSEKFVFARGRAARTVSFLHDDNHQRIKQVSTDGTTLYIKAFGVTAELFGVGTPAARWNDYLSMGNVQVGMRVTEVAAQTVSTRYFHSAPDWQEPPDMSSSIHVTMSRK